MRERGSRNYIGTKGPQRRARTFMVTNNIPRKTKARHATAQSPWPVLGSAAACVVVGLLFLVVLVAGVLMDAGAGLASDLGDESGVGAESSLGLFSSLCFPSLPGFVSPADCHRQVHRYRAGSSPPAAGRPRVQLPHAALRPRWRPSRRRYQRPRPPASQTART